MVEACVMLIRVLGEGTLRTWVCECDPGVLRAVLML